MVSKKTALKIKRAKKPDCIEEHGDVHCYHRMKKEECTWIKVPNSMSVLRCCRCNDYLVKYTIGLEPRES